jgi:predicted patatin/cPLA2 family phospholipase
MRALVISGGGSKGTFAGGVAQYLIEEKKSRIRFVFRNFYRKFAYSAFGFGSY